MKTKITKLLFTLLSIAVMGVAAVGQAGDGKTIVETAVNTGSFKTLAAALKAADLVDTLQGEGPFTVFAPTDDAFAKLPKGTVETLLKPENRDRLVAILTYHVVPGKVLAKQVVDLNGAVTVNGQRVYITASDKGVQVDNANVTATDIQCSNGVIHVIDSVILPAEKDLVETAANAGTFNTLIAAAKAAGLARALTGNDALTIFAPTDEAFAKLPEGTVESLLKPENKDQLVSILTYHVVAGRVYSEDVTSTESLKSLQGSSISVKAKKKGVRIQKAKLLKADIDASNGVIHVINKVIMPPKKSKDDAANVIDPITTIQLAVAKGSKLFNAGNHEECAQVYKSAMVELQASNGEVTDSLKKTIGLVLSKEAQETSPIAKSWLLRRGLEYVYYSLRVIDEEQEPASQVAAVELIPTNEDSLSQWYTVNDGVMGGKSDGKVTANNDVLEFAGNLSLKNNGGFASIRSKPREMNVEAGDTLVARVRGDGREYNMNLYDQTRRMAFSYRAPLKTAKGEWIDVRIPLTHFEANWFGRRVSGMKLDPSQVNSVGFILSDKQSGPFRLEVESIQVEKSE